jgi:YfiH family protein
VTGLELELPGARVLFTARAGGVSQAPYDTLNLGLWTDDDGEAVAENRRRASVAAGGRPLVHGRQVHGTGVVRQGAPGEVRDADGQATTRDDVALLVLTADCLPVAVAGEGGVAMLHAGWKGLAGGVLEEGVRALRELGVAGPLHAAIGPAAGACCYEVGDEVGERFPDWARDGRLLDLKGVAAHRLREAGVAEVADVGRCTMCEPDVFFSHRASGGATGRQAGIAWRVPGAGPGSGQGGLVWRS